MDPDTTSLQTSVNLGPEITPPAPPPEDVKKAKQNLMLLIIIAILLLLIIMGGGLLVVLKKPKSVSQKEKQNVQITGQEVTSKKTQPTKTFSERQGGILIGMGNPAIAKICDWESASVRLIDSEDITLLEKAKECGTKLVILPFRNTKDIVNDDGVGLSLVKFEQKIKPFAGKIDPYIADGTILALGLVDEPHDCNNDWGGVCPKPSEVDQAGQIAKKYWPEVTTLVNTLAKYAAGYQWQYVDIINFQYAYHKGPLVKFIKDSERVLDGGFINQISWAIQAKSGGGETFKESSMTAEQVLEVGRAMCDTKKGINLTFVTYEEELLTPEMLQALDELKTYCQ